MSPERRWVDHQRDHRHGVTGGPVLRPLLRTDAAAVLAAFDSDPSTMARQGDVTDLASAQRYVDALVDSDAQLPFAVVFGATGPHQAGPFDDERSGHLDDGYPDSGSPGEPVGLVAVTVDRTNLTGWFWYWMSAEARGRGWTSAAAATVADWALTRGGLYRLELGHRVNNPASGAVARKAGFIKEGTE